MSPLQFVEPSGLPPTINVVLYGPAGSGKTTAALSAPGPVVYLNAEGPGASQFARRTFGHEKIRELVLDATNAMGRLDEVEQYLRDGADGAQTFVMDSLGEVHRVMLEDLSKGGRFSLPTYGDVGTRLERFARAIRDMPINTVLVAHEHPVKNEVTGAVESMPFAGSASNPMLSLKLQGLVDVVGYCARVEPSDDEAKQGAKAMFYAQLIDANGRRGKNREGVLGKLRELDLTDWVGAYVALGVPPGAQPPTAVAPDAGDTTVQAQPDQAVGKRANGRSKAAQPEVVTA